MRSHPRAHPRLRGEHPPNHERDKQLTGSSPLARGTRVVSHCWLPVRGLIPARVGNTNPARRRGHPKGAHPRSRGEHVMCQHLLGSFRGSSPLARGTQLGIGADTVAKGLIPARAGNTTRHWCRYRGKGAHPRSRGEHPSDDLLNQKRPGLIPARAGNTQADPPEDSASKAHPRSRGEHAEMRR